MPVRNQVRGPAFARLRRGRQRFATANPSIGGSEVREGRLLTSILSSSEEERKENALAMPFGAAGAACFTVYVAFKVVTERLDRARRLQAEGSDSSFRRGGSDTRQSCHEQRALNRVGQIFCRASAPIMKE